MEMVSDMQSLIVAAMSVNDVPSVPLRNKTIDAIGSIEAVNSAKTYDAETLAVSAAANAKFVQLLTAIYLKRTSRKPIKSVST